MGRFINLETPKVPAAKGGGDMAVTTVQVKVITPLFGGGTTPRRPDPVDETRIRVPSVRGHLRWWWRATSGSQFQGVEELREAEARLFGSTGQGSPVRVTVKMTKLGRPVRPDELPINSGDRLFPVFRDDLDHIRADVEFELTVEYPEWARESIVTTLWAWTNFGGIGAKTRRGCGALFCAEFAPKADPATGNIHFQQWSKHVTKPVNPEGQRWPRLAIPPFVKPAAMKPLAAWRAGIEAYRTFRQQGPEAHGITSFDLLGYASHGRMASPLLLRPVSWDDGTKAAPMAVALEIGGALESGVAVRAALQHLARQQKFVRAGEYS